MFWMSRFWHLWVLFLYLYLIWNIYHTELAVKCFFFLLGRGVKTKRILTNTIIINERDILGRVLTHTLPGYALERSGRFAFHAVAIAIPTLPPFRFKTHYAFYMYAMSLSSYFFFSMTNFVPDVYYIYARIRPR